GYTRIPPWEVSGSPRGPTHGRRGHAAASGCSGGRAGKLSEERREGLRSEEMAMPFYRDHIYPSLVHLLGDPAPIRRIRERIVPGAHGTVLEIGVGSGANFVHYDPAKVSKLYALEPNPGMIRLAERQRRQTALDVEFLDLPGERIPLAAGAVD